MWHSEIRESRNALDGVTSSKMLLRGNGKNVFEFTSPKMAQEQEDRVDSHSDRVFIPVHNMLVPLGILFLKDDLKYRDWKMNPVLSCHSTKGEPTS